MLKFQCQHCGRRIAVPSGKLGKLVTCSECGMQTHPLAEQIVAAGAARAAATATAEVATPSRVTTQVATPPAHCDNCGTLIGRLETVHAWNDHSICGGCYTRLSGASGPAAVAVARRPAVLIDPGVPGAPAACGYAPGPDPKPIMLDLRERILRALIVFVVASVALYGALSLLRDIAGLIAVAAVAVIALLALYAVFRGTLAARRGAANSGALAPVRRGAS